MYLDASALLKLYIEEAESEACRALLAETHAPATSIVSRVEVGRRLGLLDHERADDARTAFADDWARLNVVGLDEHVAARAAEIGSQTGARSLDAIHLSSAERLGTTLLTFDRRQAEAARLIDVVVHEA